MDKLNGDIIEQVLNSIQQQIDKHSQEKETIENEINQISDIKIKEEGTRDIEKLEKEIEDREEEKQAFLRLVQENNENKKIIEETNKSLEEVEIARQHLLQEQEQYREEISKRKSYFNKEKTAEFSELESDYNKIASELALLDEKTEKYNQRLTTAKDWDEQYSKLIDKTLLKYNIQLEAHEIDNIIFDEAQRHIKVIGANNEVIYENDPQWDFTSNLMNSQKKVDNDELLKTIIQENGGENIKGLDPRILLTLKKIGNEDALKKYVKSIADKDAKMPFELTYNLKDIDKLDPELLEKHKEIAQIAKEQNADKVNVIEDTPKKQKAITTSAKNEISKHSNKKSSQSIKKEKESIVSKICLDEGTGILTVIHKAGNIMYQGKISDYMSEKLADIKAQDDICKEFEGKFEDKIANKIDPRIVFALYDLDRDAIEPYIESIANKKADMPFSIEYNLKKIYSNEGMHIKNIKNINRWAKIAKKQNRKKVEFEKDGLRKRIIGNLKLRKREGKLLPSFSKTIQTLDSAKTKTEQVVANQKNKANDFVNSLKNEANRARHFTSKSIHNKVNSAKMNSRILGARISGYFKGNNPIQTNIDIQKIRQQYNENVR